MESVKTQLKMRRKSKKSLSDKENDSPEPTENKTIPLDSTDTDIIECSIVGNENKFLKTGKSSIKKLSTKAEDECINQKNCSLSKRKDSVTSLRLSLRNSYRITEEVASGKKSELSFHTPQPNRNFNESSSMIKKIISSLKKTPEGPYLTKSKLRNVEQWLRENDVETVNTPPFANLSVTPVKSSRKKQPIQWRDKPKMQDSSIDSEVEDVLKAVYGDDWLQKNIQSRCKTEPKKKSNIYSPLIRTEKKLGAFTSTKRNILSAKKLNLLDSSEEDIINLDSSFLSGVKAINLDGSDCSYEQIKTKQLNKVVKEKKYEMDTSSVESYHLSPGKKKKSGNIPSNKKEQTPKNSTSKKLGVPIKTPIISSSKKLGVALKTPKDSTTKNLGAGFKTPKKTFLASLSVSTPNSRCHPDAQDYKINFKSKKEELVKKLYKLYNSEIFDGKLAEDMNFSWNVKLRGTAGYCYNKRITKSTGDVIRLSRIEFSTKIVDRADRLRDTMIHELCHAASWVIDGVLDGHGAIWSQWASRAMNRFPELPLIKRCHNYEIVSKYVYRCTGCGYSIKRHSKSINIERKRCGHCYGVLELLVNKKRRGKGEVPEFDTTRTLRTPNKFALFVKENYHTVKSSKTNAKHAEIMKALSQQYALTKSGRKSGRKLDE